MPHMGNSQLEPVDVADLTIKIGAGEVKEIYYGFAKGDQIIFNFEELKRKPLKEISITEIPSNSKFSEFKCALVSNKKIIVNKNSIYKFKFRNGSVGGRVCNIRIQRIPETKELITFNTDWKWKTVYDTTFIPYVENILVRYDTLSYKETVKEVIKVEKIEDMIMDKIQRVHSYWNPSSSYTYLKVELPKNINEEYKEENVVAWAYWIGVGDDATQAYARNVESIGKVAIGLANVYGTPLAGLALGAVKELLLPKKGEDVQYAFMDSYDNTQAFLKGQAYYQFDQGKGVAAYGKNSSLLQGTFYIGLHNDNSTLGIDVNVKIVVIKEIKTYDDIEYDRIEIEPIYDSINKIREIVNATKIRVNAE